MARHTLYLMLGYPGAGKTTTARIIHELTEATHIWEDEVRLKRFGRPVFSQAENDDLHNHLNTMTGELLSDGRSVIYDTSFNAYEDRERMYHIADAADAETKLIWVNTDRTTARNRATKNAKAQNTRILATVLGDMDLQTFERLSNKLEPPRHGEPHIEIDGTKVNVDYVEKLLLQT